MSEKHWETQGFAVRESQGDKENRMNTEITAEQVKDMLEAHDQHHLPPDGVPREGCPECESRDSFFGAYGGTVDLGQQLVDEYSAAHECESRGER